MHTGPHIKRDGLVFAIDASSRRSTLRATQESNILPSPHNWTVGTGGQTGYSPNGSSSEQNRVLVNDDPWGRSSITWRTTPDATSGADGGWNSSYYTIDTRYTYRYSMWVRRYTSGTGGTFYMGMNPNPLRNDNGASQGNPYFTYPSIASLTQNQWYLVVAHVFYEGYTGGRHPQSGWYENGVKISDKSYGNVGAQDVRWASETTSAMHRAYHYYTTNVNSGIEFAYPRVDKIDGKEPSINELINRGESGVRGLVSKSFFTPSNGVSYTGTKFKKSFLFDGTDDSFIIDDGIDSGYQRSFEYVVKFNTISGTYEPIAAYTYGTGAPSGRVWLGLQNISGYRFRMHGWGSDDPYATSTSVTTGKFYHVIHTYNYNTRAMRIYVNGVDETSDTYDNQGLSAWSNTSAFSWHLGYDPYSYGGVSHSNIELPIFKSYNKELTSQEVKQNFRAYKNRFDI
ncbi:LamG domain-containing protein [bacterium]|nr:LamG domain-containing protein [bacterium]